MSNQPQPQPRPWFRLATLARASQPQTPPTPATSQPQTQAPVAPLSRAPTFRPAFRPIAPAPQPRPPSPRAAIPTPPPPAAAPPPSQPPLTTRAPAPPPPSATAPPPPSAPAPPKLPISTTSAPPSPLVGAVPKPPSPGPATPRSPPASLVASPPKPTPPPPPSTPPPSISSSPKTLQRSPPPTTPPPTSPRVQKTSPLIVTKRELPSSSFPSPPKPSSPVPKTSDVVAPSSLKASPVAMATRLPTPVASPRAAADHPLPETPKQSPVTAKPTSAAPPSPLTLPPSQIIPPEAEKNTVVQEATVPKRKPRNGAHAKPKGRDVFWKSSDDEEGGLRVITIAGENQGAVMELGYSPRRRGGGSVLHKVVKSEQADQVSGDEGRSKMEAQNGKTKPGLPMNAIMNSNVQGVNGSILLNSKCFHNDPGVHFSLTRKPFNGHHAQGKGAHHHGNGGNNSYNRENGKWFSN